MNSLDVQQWPHQLLQKKAKLITCGQIQRTYPMEEFSCPFPGWPPLKTSLYYKVRNMGIHQNYYLQCSSITTVYTKVQTPIYTQVDKYLLSCNTKRRSPDVTLIWSNVEVQLSIFFKFGSNENISISLIYLEQLDLELQKFHV